MADYYGTLNTTWRDFRGFTARVSLTVHSPTSEADLVTRAAALVTDMVGMTSAALIKTTGLIISNYPSAYGSNTVYSDIATKMELELHTGAGNNTRLSLPSPLADCFYPDGMTYFPTGNASLDSIITAIGNGTIVQAITLAEQFFDNGFFRDRRRKRRIGKKTLNPSGTGSA